MLRCFEKTTSQIIKRLKPLIILDFTVKIYRHFVAKYISKFYYCTRLAASVLRKVPRRISFSLLPLVKVNTKEIFILSMFKLKTCQKAFILLNHIANVLCTS